MTARAQRRASRSTAIDLQEASDEALLAMRLCDLPIQLDDTLMARRVLRLHRELARNGTRPRASRRLSHGFAV